MITHNGKKYLRISTILQPFSGINKAPPDKVYEKGLIGEALHEHAADFINGIGIWDPYQNSEMYFESFKKWWQKDPKKALITEKRFFCDQLNITGKCDLVYEQDGIVTLCDYKTSYAEGKTWPIQGSVYQYLINGTQKIDRIEFVHLDKTGDYPNVIEYEYNFEQFLIILEVFKLFFATKEQIKILEQ